ncbi:hypothetical protein [Enterobacter roggenkampii]|uniref:hypothetical protein n=1 Tax=Enterobacter roggenkampii TaxID=1812935 RepID=UPI00200617D9|nr:hypothetical protein [Enterobacter roggenkampii]MCK6843219.1 hypothetical protein [Enterobacter roggenkampii]
MFISNYWKGWLKFFERRNNQAIIKNSDMTLFVITVFLNLTQILLPIIVALFLRLFPIAPELAYRGKQKLLSFNMRYYSKAVFFCSLFFCSLSHAAPLTPADRDTVRQQQEELLLKNQQQREELERSIPRPAPARPLPVTGSGPCFTIHTITLSGATLISPENPADPCRAGR